MWIAEFVKPYKKMLFWNKILFQMKKCAILNIATVRIIRGSIGVVEGAVSMNILVIDDSKTNLGITEQYLKVMQDVDKIVLSSAPRNVKSLIAQNDIDVLLLDVVMPEFDGFQVLELLRAEHQYDDLPILMFTSLSDAESFKKCFALGASDYINKPIHPIEFNARVNAAIDNRRKTKRLQEVLSKISNQNIELKEINAKLVKTRYTLLNSEKMAAIGQLAAGIAHEINNPMGFVSSNFETLVKYLKRIEEYFGTTETALDALQHSEDPRWSTIAQECAQAKRRLKIAFIMEELDGIMTDSLDGIQRVTNIVQSLRTFARSEKNEEKAFYNLKDLVEQVILISYNEVKYVSNVDTDIPEDIQVYCNKVQIGQVLINLLVNAGQAIKSQQRSDMGHIKIHAEEKGHMVHLEISDDGPGIPQKYLNRIFDPFFTTKEVGQGTGLGLSISYDIISNKHKGKIDVKTEVGKGTRFIIQLPQDALQD